MKITLSLLCLFFILSCGQNNATDKTAENTTAPAPTTSTEPQPLTPLTYPALYSNWDIGKRDNMNTVLSLYKAWDESSVDSIKNLFADSVILDLPGGRRVTANPPSSPVVNVRTDLPVASLMTSIVAPLMTAPLLSSTTPEIPPV